MLNLAPPPVPTWPTMQPKAGAVVAVVNGVSINMVKAAARVGVHLVQQPSTALALPGRASDQRELSAHLANLNWPDDYLSWARRFILAEHLAKMWLRSLRKRNFNDSAKFTENAPLSFYKSLICWAYSEVLRCILRNESMSTSKNATRS